MNRKFDFVVHIAKNYIAQVAMFLMGVRQSLIALPAIKAFF
jgi:hypothetical protein